MLRWTLPTATSNTVANWSGSKEPKLGLEVGWSDTRRIWFGRKGSGGARTEIEIDSVFSKLESYGLVSRIPSPNNLKLMTEFQNRYVLLLKGLHSAELVTAKPSLDSLK